MTGLAVPDEEPGRPVTGLTGVSVPTARRIPPPVADPEQRPGTGAGRPGDRGRGYHRSVSATTLRTRGGESPALARFHPLVREWFTRAFPAPTPAQERGWPPIADGEHSLILAPTGSGKTLAAFLWALNGIVEPVRPDGSRRGCSTSRP